MFVFKLLEAIHDFFHLDFSELALFPQEHKNIHFAASFVMLCTDALKLSVKKLVLHVPAQSEENLFLANVDVVAFGVLELDAVNPVSQADRFQSSECFKLE